MIEIRGNHGKSDIFNYLVQSGWAGIIIEDFFISPLDNVWVVDLDLEDKDAIEGVLAFIKEELANFQNVVLYSNYTYQKIKPLIKKLYDMERDGRNFAVMYRNNFYTWEIE